VKPYYEQDGIAIYHGDCREVLPSLSADVLVTDPPFGIGYFSNRTKCENVARSIAGDEDTRLRDWVLSWWGDKPALVFGSPGIPAPPQTRMNLVWHKPGSGMGDLSLPWKPDYEFIHVIGAGFTGHRGESVFRYPLRVFRGDLLHPHQKPEDLIEMLLAKCPVGKVIDPFIGSGSTLVAAKASGRRAIGIEIEERYCEIAANRLAQGVLFGAGENPKAAELVA
jgi:hypothetical protein